MGLFGKKETCCICNQNEGAKKISTGMICNNCLKKIELFIGVFELKNKTYEDILQAIQANERNSELENKFKTTNKVDKYLEIDENNKLWYAPCFTNVFFTFEEIVSFELLENGNTISKGGIGGALAGGALFGDAGAVVGAAVGKRKIKQEITQYLIKIITRNRNCPEVYINFLTTGKLMSDSIVFKSRAGTAQQVLTMLTLMMDGQNKTISENRFSAADEIMKYKKLLDDGILTQEEFEEKKKQLLER